MKVALKGRVCMHALVAACVSAGAVSIPTQAKAQALNPVVDVCSGLSLNRSAVTDLIGAVNRPIVGSVQGVINDLVDVTAVLPGVSIIAPLNIDLEGILAAAAAGDPISVQVLDTDGNIISPSDGCNLAVDGIQFNTDGGIAIGGNSITGLGAGGRVATAGAVGAVALGDDASTSAGAGSAVAIGESASVTGVGSVALGAGSVADEDATVSIGAAGSERRLVNVAAGVGATDATNLGQVEDLIADAGALDVVYDSAALGQITLAGTDGTVIAGLAAGEVSATSDEAVNGAQLFAVDERVTANTGDIADLTADVGGIDTRLGDLDVRVGGIDTRVDGIDTRLTLVEAGIAAIPASPVQYRSDIDSSVPSAVPTNTAGLVGADASSPVLLTNVAEGSLALGSTDAVNGAQLGATNTRVTAAEDQIAVNGALISANTASIAANTGEIIAIDNRVTFNSDAITALDLRIEAIEIGGPAPAPVGLSALEYRSDTDPSQPSAVRTNTVGLVGADATQPVTMTNVAAGSLDADSTEAVNGAQLGATNARLADAETAIAANGTAIAAVDTRLGAAETSIASNTDRITSAEATIVANSTRLTDAEEAIAVNATGISDNARDIARLGSEIGSATLGAVRYSDPDSPNTPNGGIPTNDVVLVGADASEPVRIHNVANGVADNDAVNVGQLNAAMAGMAGQMNGFAQALDVHSVRLDAIEFDLADARRDASAGTAGATAMANMPQPMDRGASMVSGGVGHHRGETAFAIGFSSAFESGLIVKAGASVDTRGAGTFGAGAGFQF